MSTPFRVSEKPRADSRKQDPDEGDNIDVPNSDFTSFLLTDVAWRAATVTSDDEYRGDSDAAHDSHGEDNGHDDVDGAAAANRSERECIQTVGGLLFNHDPMTGVRFWHQHGVCDMRDPSTVASLVASADGLALERVTQLLTDTAGPPGLATAFATCTIGQRGTPIVTALRQYFARVHMPSDPEQWRQLLDAFAEAYVRLNTSIISSIEDCARIVTAILTVNEGLHVDGNAKPGGQRRPMESRAGFVLELRGTMQPAALAATFDAVAAAPIAPGVDHTDDCKRALAMITGVDLMAYVIPLSLACWYRCYYCLAVCNSVTVIWF